MSRKNTLLMSSILGAGLYPALAVQVAEAAPAGCHPNGTPKDDVIFCLGVDFKGVAAGRGDDEVTIVLGGAVTTFALDPRPLTVVIDGGEGDDLIINNGTIVADVTSFGNGLLGSPGLGAGKSKASNSATDGKKTATAIGIDGGDGDDDIQNTGSVTAISVTTSGGAPIGPGVLGGQVGAAEARAHSIGIKGGDGNDTIFNGGTAMALSDAVVLKGEISTGLGLSTSNDAAVAAATATGIDGGAGDDEIINDGDTIAIATALIAAAGGPGSGDNSSANAGNTAEATATGIAGGDGADDIDNQGSVVATASAAAESFTLALSANGSAKGDSTSTAKSAATAVATGDDADVVHNGGSLVATATSISAAQGAQVSDSGGAPLPKSSWKGGAAAEATATGVSTGGGNDSVTSDGSIIAVATSVAGTATAALSASDMASAASDAKATASATGVDSGVGGDWVTNDGSITAVATATAGAVDLAFSQDGKAKAAHDGGATAEADATGIRADSGDNTRTTATEIKILPHSLTLTKRWAESAPVGDDTITNSGDVTAVATALSGAESASVSISGAATSEMGASAKATTTGIDAGAGNDSVVNSGAVTAVSTATAGTIGISFSESGKSAVKGGPEAEATALGIGGDGTGTDTVYEASLGLTTDSIATSLSRETTAAAGADRITNSGDITAVATALGGAEGGAISVSGAASADFSSKATAKATALDAGSGNDVVTNSGALTAVSSAIAGTAGIGFSESKDSSAKAGAAAEAEATGISGDGAPGSTLTEGSLSVGLDGVAIGFHHETNAATGDDSITNSGAVTAVASAISGAGTGAVSISGAASAEAKSTAKSLAMGIDAGDGDDSVTNSGAVTAVSTATAGALAISFSEEGGAKVEGGPEAEAEAVGISGDGTQTSSHFDTTLVIGPDGLSADLRLAKTAAGGADTITNSGAVTSVATAISGTEGAAASISGAAEANMESKATATATALNAGAGDDVVKNSGALTAVATATAGTIGLSFSEKKEGSVETGATSEAEAVGISGDGGLGSRETEAALAIGPDGLSASFRHARTSATGDDDITNSGAITAVATALSASGAVGVSIEEGASADAKSTAFASASAIDAGAGDDVVTNSGVLTAVADATAGEVSAAVSMKGNATGIKSIWKGGAEASAEAVGISGDSTGKDFSIEGELAISFTELDVKATTTTFYNQAGGNDDITNAGVVTATAVATAPSANVAVGLKDMAAAVTSSSAAAKAVAIDGGSGDDIILNQGVLVSTAEATAATANVAVSKDAALAADAFWDGGTTAEATAVGISGDGEGRDLLVEGSLKVNGGGVHADARVASTVVSGNDDITNEGTVVVTAAALTPTASVAVSTKGVGAAVSASTAISSAAGIDAGSGDDTIANSGELVVSSAAIAAAANVSVSKSAALAGNSAWDGGTTAEAEAVGISGDGKGTDLVIEGAVEVTSDRVFIGGSYASTTVSGDEDITNDGTIVTTAFAEVPSLSVGVSSKGLSAAASTATATAVSAGIDAGAGDDIVTNTGSLTATSIANANVLDVAVTSSGVSVAGGALWDGGASAESQAVGISGDGKGSDLVIEGAIEVTDEAVRLGSRYAATTVKGDDTITNEGVITATSVAAAPSVGVAVTPSGGLSAAVTSAKASSEAVAIDAGSGDDVVDNSGVLTSSAAALAASASVAYVSGGVAVAGNAVWDGGTTAEAEAVGISGDGKGRDLIISGEIEVADGDVLIGSELTDKVVSGDDTITNSGVITTSAFAESASLGVAVTLSGGVSAAVSTSTADSRATGIDAGSGDDVVDNTSVITSTAVANANALSVAYASAGVAVAADAVMDGGTTAKAEAIGISGDGEGRDLTIEGSIAATDAGTLIAGRIADEKVAGNDTITNDSVITATAVALAPSVGVAVTPGGLAAAISTASTETRSAAIDAGAGDDIVDNSGVLTATSISTSVAVPVAVTPAGVAVATDAVWDGGTTAEAEAVGISGDGEGTDFVSEFSMGASDGDVSIYARDAATTVSGNDVITNDGVITSSAFAESISAAVSVTPAGLAVAASKSTADSQAVAIDAGSGDDVVENAGTLTATAAANANALSVAITPAGLSVAAGSVFDGGTKANAEAVGISGDGKGRDDIAEFAVDVDENGVHLLATDSSTVVSGADTITNSGTVTATAVALAPSIGVAVTPAGVSVASTTASAESRAAAIDAGAGDDIIDNSGTLTATAVANADAVSVAVTPAGVAVASDAVWDGGTSAYAEAIGIAGDGEGRDDISGFGIEANNEAISLHAFDQSTTTSGDDDITNSGNIVATAVAAVPSINVAVTPAGVSAALSTATTEARAVAIDAGAGDDMVDNSGDLTAVSTAVSVAIPVAVTPAGVAIAGDAIWDGGTSATSEAVGISGDGEGFDEATEFWMSADALGFGVGTRDSTTAVSGDDSITNTADVTAVAVGVATSIGVSVTPAGVSASASTATAEARAAAIDAGAGDDNVDNEGHLSAVSEATALAIPVAVAPVGFAVAADAIWDGGTEAQAEAVGIDGDGRGDDRVTENTIETSAAGTLIQRTSSTSAASGNDTITNRGEVDATAVAVAPSVAFSLGVVGGVSAANATAGSSAAAIDAGAGDDDVFNQGDLTATSVANADGIAISVGALAASGNAIFQGGTTAEAEAVGISGDGRGGVEASEFTIESDGVEHRLTYSESLQSAAGDDNITNEGQIAANATAVAPSVSLAIGGMGVAISTSTARSQAAAIDAGAGNDFVGNSGALTADAHAVAVTANVATGAGVAADAVWDGGTTAEAEAVGISGDGQATSESTTRGIVLADSAATLFETTNSSSLSGNDDIANSASIDATANATAVSVGVAFAGFAPGAAVSTSTARSRAAAIEAGGGDDGVLNSGDLTAEAGSSATAVSVSLGAGITASLDAVWDGGTTAEATAVGIDGDGQDDSITRNKTITVSPTDVEISDETVRESTDGDDSITNSGSIDAAAGASSTSVGVSVNVAIGLSAAISTSTAKADATAIQGGGGNDTIFNEGALTATSMADADAVSVSIVPVGAAVSADAVWDGGTTAQAASSGIDGGAGDDTITNRSTIMAGSVADAGSTSVAVSVAGISSSLSASTADARATAIKGGSGSDNIDNSGDLEAAASATARATSVSVGLVGFGSTDSSALADARAIGIDAGDGDDVVGTTGNIVAAANASATGADVAVELVGAGLSDSLFEGEIRAEALAAGSLGGDGADELTNDAAIVLSSNAEISSTSVSVGLIGFAEADTSATASARATGMAGGADDDILNNRGVIAAWATSNAPARSISVGLIGASHADASTTAIAAAGGLDGGAGNDGLYNLGIISLNAFADAQAKSVDVTLAGVGHADANANAIAAAIGLDGGAGDDEVFNFGSIDLEASAEALALGTSVGIFGTASQSANSTASAVTIGLAGGDGKDMVANTGSLQTRAESSARISNAAWTLAGVAAQQGLLGAQALAIGMSGGGDDDTLFNIGDLDVDVIATLESDGSVTAVFGGGSANASLAATLGGTGMAGDEGDDQIINADLVTVDSYLTASSSGTAWNLIGSAGVGAGISAETSLFGLSGGAGDDLIANAGALLVGAHASMNATSSSWTFLGGASGAGALSADTAATGVAGGGGADWLHNEGLVDVDAISVLSASGGSDAIFGNADLGASLTAEAVATGMDGGDGDDVIENFWVVDASSVSILNSATASFTFLGGASGSASLWSSAGSTGVFGGFGSDQIYNGGSILAAASAITSADGGAQTLVGDANVTTTALAAATAAAIEGGEGSDLIVNTGALNASASASPTSHSDVSAGGFFADGISRASTNASADALGAGLGGGNNTLANFGTLAALAGGSGTSIAASNGSDFSLTADAFARATSTISSTRARGIAATDGTNAVNNQGGISATVDIEAISNGDADGSGLVGGNGDAFARSQADGVEALGIDIGDGDNLIANAGNVAVLAEHRADASALGDANGINFFEAVNSTASAQAFADDALAIGIRAGHGDNTIWNGGSVSVEAAPVADSLGRAISTDFSFAVDAAANAEAYANNARAFGIYAGDGANLIYNAGSISATSTPFARAVAHSQGRGWDGDAQSTATASADNALAVGIFAGDGGNMVINDGTIVALAAPTAIATATATPGGAELAGAVSNTVVCTWKSKWHIFNWILQKVCTVVEEIADGVVDDGEVVLEMSATVDGAEALGVWTGAGDDVIVNNGSIATMVSAGGVDRLGIAIRSGAGDDSVILKDGSSLAGDIELGSGDDGLYLLGTPSMEGDFHGGSGWDSLHVDGTSQLFGSAFGFEALTLYGTSSFTLNALNSVENLGVHEGTLNVLGNYTMSPTGTFGVHINADGSHGQLTASGNVALGGTLNVTRGPGPYVGGTTYDIVSAGSVSGGFTVANLPAPTTLVSFSLLQDATSVNIVANVTPFTAMASDAGETAVAGYLDDVLPTSTGDLSALLAMMQALPEEDFGAAFQSLDPSTYDTYQVADSTMRQHLSAAQSRMAGIRASFNDSGPSAFMSGAAPVYLSPVTFEARFFSPQGGESAQGKRRAPLDAWLVGFISNGDQSGLHGGWQGSTFTTAGTSLGVDYAVSNKFLFGISYGSAYGESRIDFGYGSGEMGSTTASLYATYLPSEKTYVETVVSQSTSRYANRREVRVGADERTAFSMHKNDLFSIFAEAGRDLGAGRFRSQLYGSFDLSSFRENGFEEMGAGAVNIIVDPRHYATVSTELGLRGAVDIETRRGLLTPQISLALLRNFEFGDRLSARFEGASDLAFTPAGNRIAGSGARLGLGLNFSDENGWAVLANFNAETGGRGSGLAGVLQLSRRF